jgi:DNA primase
MRECPVCGKKTLHLLNSELEVFLCYNCGYEEVPDLPILAVDGGYPAERYQTAEDICKAAEAFYRSMLLEGQAAAAREYLKSRKFSSSAIERYGLGYAPCETKRLLTHLIGKGYKPEDVADAGLATENDEGEWKDCLRDRLVFPLRNAAGKTVGFSGRHLGEGRKSAKYMNTHASILYARNSLLYNLDRALQSKKDYVLLVEGYADTITLASYGFDNVVASMGTTLSDMQIQLISHKSKEAVVLYDGDGPGIKAMVNAVDALLSAGIVAHGVVLPDGHDPDSFMQQHGRKQLEQRIDGARRSFTLPDTGGIPIPAKTILLDFIKRQDIGKIQSKNA